MKISSRWVGAVVLGCLWSGPLWAAPAPAAGTDPVDSALEDVLSGKDVTGATARELAPPAGAASAIATTPTTTDGEIVKYALARFDGRVAAYDNALHVVDAADASYRSYFDTYNRAVAAINAKIGGNQTTAMTYPDLEKLRDTSQAAAKKSLAEMQADAVQAATLHAALVRNPLYAYGYQEMDYGKSHTDVGLFAKQLRWGATVNPDLRYVLHKGATSGTIASMTTTGAAPTPAVTNAAPATPVPTEAAIAAEFKPAVMADLDTIVVDYNNLVRNANTAEMQYKQAQAAYQKGTKSRPANSVRRTVRVRVGRRWVTQAVPDAALNNWNNQQQGQQAAASSAQANLQTNGQGAAERLRFLKQFPLLMADNYKQVKNTTIPELPLLERK